MNRSKTQMFATLAICFAMALAAALVAQTNSPSGPAAHRTVLEKHDLSINGYEGVLVRTELAPGAKEPPHTHPGDFLAYVEEGTLTLVQDGKPTTTVKAGEVFFVPKGQVHSGENNGKVTTKLLVSFIVQKGQPLTSAVK